MAKFYENIGFAISTEVKPGVWKDVIQTYPYYGEITRNVRSLQQANQLNDNINISNEFSIVADPFARKNFCVCGVCQQSEGSESNDSDPSVYPYIFT